MQNSTAYTLGQLMTVVMGVLCRAAAGPQQAHPGTPHIQVASRAPILAVSICPTPLPCTPQSPITAHQSQVLHTYHTTASTSPWFDPEHPAPATPDLELHPVSLLPPGQNPCTPPAAPTRCPGTSRKRNPAEGLRLSFRVGLREGLLCRKPSSDAKILITRVTTD